MVYLWILNVGLYALLVIKHPISQLLLFNALIKVIVDLGLKIHDWMLEISGF